jgi:flagellar protein FliO/FliZ
MAVPLALAADRTPLDLPAAEPVTNAAAAGDGGGGITRLVIGLFVVVALIWALRWVLEQVKAAKEGQASGAGLSALASLPLGPNRSVHLVRAGSDYVLLGVAEQVTPIRSYTEAEARAAGLLAEDGGVPAAPTLVASLRQRTVRR